MRRRSSVSPTMRGLAILLIAVFFIVTIMCFGILEALKDYWRKFFTWVSKCFWRKVEEGGILSTLVGAVMVFYLFLFNKDFKGWIAPNP